jgi:hypothetical protein
VDGPGRPRHLRIIDAGAGPVRRLGAASSSLVYADRFDDRDLAWLRDHALQGVDRAGQLVVSARHLAIVVQRPGAAGRAGRGRALANVRAAAVQAGAPGVAAVRGPVTVRLGQHLVDHPGRRWSPTGLAAFDGDTTVATASRFLAELRRLGLVSLDRHGRHAEHTVVDPPLLLDWIADRVPRRAPRRHLGYLRARDVEQLVAALAVAIERAGVAAVITGAAAALVEGALTTSALPVVSVRVDTVMAGDLPSAAAALGLAPGQRGANVALIDDVGRVGTLHGRSVEGVPLASRARVWLDLRAERRGEALADLYRGEFLLPRATSAATGP